MSHLASADIITKELPKNENYMKLTTKESTMHWGTISIWGGWEIIYIKISWTEYIQIEIYETQSEPSTTLGLNISRI